MKNKSVIKKRKIGNGIVNSIINKLPFEMHMPGNYRYCGPGTKLEKRLARGDPGINALDEACKQHDISYSKHLKGKDRYIADKILSEKAWQRVKSKDATLGEKATAFAVTSAMKAKMGLSKIGMGITKNKKKKNIKIHSKKLFNEAVKGATIAIKEKKT